MLPAGIVCVCAIVFCILLHKYSVTIALSAVYIYWFAFLEFLATLSWLASYHIGLGIATHTHTHNN